MDIHTVKIAAAIVCAACGRMIMARKQSAEQDSLHENRRLRYRLVIRTAAPGGESFGLGIEDYV
jgi:hypothetical protein